MPPMRIAGVTGGNWEDILVSVPCRHVLLIQLNRMEVRNALRTQTLREIATVLDAADRDAQIRVAVITGGDTVFAAGADIRELAKLDTAAARADARPQHWRAIAGFSKPLIAAVNGYALGAGCELALLADLLIASDTARFGQPEINLGIIPGAGGIQRLIRAVGKPLAMNMVLTGAAIDAATAHRAGLLSSPPTSGSCQTQALTLASAIASNAPLAVRAAKRMMNLSEETGLADGLVQDREAFCQLMDSADKHEGVAAFLEKRRPLFTGN